MARLIGLLIFLVLTIATQVGGLIFALSWIVGRFIYMQGYMVDPAKRSQGFLIQGIAVTVLFLGALVGTVMTLAGA